MNRRLDLWLGQINGVRCSKVSWHAAVPGLYDIVVSTMSWASQNEAREYLQGGGPSDQPVNPTSRGMQRYDISEFTRTPVKESKVALRICVGQTALTPYLSPRDR